jgi:hypothetical protein
MTVKWQGKTENKQTKQQVHPVFFGLLEVLFLIILVREKNFLSEF